MAYNLRSACDLAKLVFIDLDGTLLNSRHQLTERTQRAVIKLAAQKQIVLSSARPLTSVLQFARALQLTSLVSALNGAIIAASDGKIYHRTSIDPGLLAVILAQVGHLAGVSINLYSGADWLVCELDERIQQESAIVGLQPTIIKQRLWHYDAPVEKLLLICEPAQEQNLLQLLTPYQTSIAMTFSKTGYLEITAKPATKINSAAIIAKHYQLSLQQCIAIGDGEVDLAMLVGCGVGVAMGNATAALQRLAHTTIKTNDEDGVAIFLETILNYQETTYET